MKRRRALCGLLVIVVLGLMGSVTGCRDAAVSEPPVLPTTMPTVATVVSTTAPAVLPTIASTPLPSASPPSPSVPPTPIPLAPLKLLVPSEWEMAVQPLLNQHNQRSDQPWHLLAAPDPAAALAQNQGDAALIPNGPGELVFREPLVLAVPFTTDWETVSLADAEAIAANGHNLVTVLPWSELQPTHKALRIDGRSPADPDYPLQERITLAANPAAATAAADLLPLLQAELAPQPVVHLAAVGDVMLDRALGDVLRQGNLAYPFAQVADLLSRADVTVGNVESALGDVGRPELKSYPFQAPPEAAPALAQAGFDVVSLANNHGMDYGPESLLQAISLLQANGVAPIGAGANADAAHAPYRTEINGVSLAFLAYVNVPVEVAGFDTAVWTATATAPGLAWGAPDVITADVTTVRPEVDLVVVVLHSGYEYIEEPSEAQVAAAQAAIDAGADLVIGHHAHILQGIQFYNGGVIVYGLGNFAFEIDGPPETAVLNVWLDQNGVRELELLPAIIQKGGQPRPAEPWEAGPIRQQVYTLTRLLNPGSP